MKKYINICGLIPACILIVYAGIAGFYMYDEDEYIFLSIVIPFSISAGILIAPGWLFRKIAFRIFAFIIGLADVGVILLYVWAFLALGAVRDVGPIPPVVLVVLILNILLGIIATLLVGLRAIGGV